MTNKGTCQKIEFQLQKRYTAQFTYAHCTPSANVDIFFWNGGKALDPLAWEANGGDDIVTSGSPEGRSGRKGDSMRWPDSKVYIFVDETICKNYDAPYMIF